MRLPFIGEVVARDHHEEVVRELKAQITRLEQDRRIAWNRLFETVQGIPLEEAMATAGEPARAADPVPHHKMPERPEDEQQAFEATRLGTLLTVAGRRMSKIVRRVSHDKMADYNRADEKRKAAEMFDLARIQANADAQEAQRLRDLAEAGEDKPGPRESASGR